MPMDEGAAFAHSRRSALVVVRIETPAVCAPVQGKCDAPCMLYGTGWCEATAPLTIGQSLASWRWLREGTAHAPCCTHAGDFTCSMRPSARCALLTRILFTAHGGWGRQAPDASPPWGKFTLTARLLHAPGARDCTSTQPRVTILFLEEGGYDDQAFGGRR